MPQRKSVKLVTLGSIGVGKTVFLQSLNHGGPVRDQHAHPTLYPDIFKREIKRNGRTYDVSFWDTAGRERSDQPRSNYLRNADGAFIMFDDSPQSRKDVIVWVESLLSINKAAEWVLLKTKSDVFSKSEELDCTDFDRFCRLCDKPFFHVSSYEYKCIDEAFDALFERVVSSESRQVNHQGTIRLFTNYCEGNRICGC